MGASHAQARLTPITDAPPLRFTTRWRISEIVLATPDAPESCIHHQKDSPPAKKAGSEAPKGACHPLAAHRRQVYAVCANQSARGSAPKSRGALAFRRFTAALASAVATASGSAPEPRFLGRGWGGCFARLGPVQSCELLADRSLCRPSGAPEPPGSGVQIRWLPPP